MDVEFGFMPRIVIADRVFVDLDRNGLQDPGDSGLGGVQLVLRSESGGVTPLATTTSAGNGAYSFSNFDVQTLLPSDTEVYYVDIVIDQPALKAPDGRSYLIASPPATPDPVNDSNGVAATVDGQSVSRATVSFPTPTRNETIDFGFEEPPLLGAQIGKIEKNISTFFKKKNHFRIYKR